MEGEIRCCIFKLPLVPGRYRITPRILSDNEVEDYVDGASFLIVDGGDFFGTGRYNSHSPVLIDHSWNIRSKTA